jgi:hypothetical protein
MKKRILVISVFFLSIITVYAQNNTNPIPQMDAAIKDLAENIHKKLIEEKTEKIAIGQFTYRGNVVPLCIYWSNQLTEELTNKPRRPYTVLSGGTAGTDRTISGEIVDAANSIRIYTRIIRTDRAIELSSHFDLERNEHINVMISSGDSNRSSSSVYMDSFEPDSFDNPVPYEIGIDENVQIMNRTLHNADEDFFLLIPESDGRLIMETTGEVDTYMEFYNADTREKLDDDDDSGSRLNARIRYNVQAGKRYIAKVRGCSRSDTGSYGFRAYLQVRIQLAPDEYEPDNDSSSAKLFEIGKPQQHTFHNSNDIDWVKFQVTRPGRYTIRTRGVNSNRLDTYIELYNSDLRLIGEDDDGGEMLDSRLSIRLENGLYYLKVICLDDEPDQPYTISIEAE